jgi:hypothetical protein
MPFEQSKSCINSNLKITFIRNTLESQTRCYLIDIIHYRAILLESAQTELFDAFAKLSRGRNRAMSHSDDEISTNLERT